jgi:hypothetical protein
MQRIHRISASNFIIISGSGKKVGKTHLAIAFIRHFSVQSPIIGIKISPHRHDKLGNVDMVTENKEYRLFREFDVHEKNSGQYLEAGAVASYFLETEDEFLEEAIMNFSERCIPDKLPVICESGVLGKILRPGIMFYIESADVRPDPGKDSVKTIADHILPARIFSPFEAIERVRLSDKCWSTGEERFKIPG